jgi:hypothetical protein
MALAGGPKLSPEILINIAEPFFNLPLVGPEDGASDTSVGGRYEIFEEVLETWSETFTVTRRSLPAPAGIIAKKFVTVCVPTVRRASPDNDKVAPANPRALLTTPKCCPDTEITSFPLVENKVVFKLSKTGGA